MSVWEPFFTGSWPFAPVPFENIFNKLLLLAPAPAPNSSKKSPAPDPQQVDNKYIFFSAPVWIKPLDLSIKFFNFYLFVSGIEDLESWQHRTLCLTGSSLFLENNLYWLIKPQSSDFFIYKSILQVAFR